jgi:alpha-L-rhamnosidase
VSSTGTTPANAVVTRLVSQIPTGVLVASADPLRLTWQVSTSTQGLQQLAYEVQAAASDAFEAGLATTGVVDSDDQVAIPDPGAPLKSREVRHYRVRIQTEIGWSDWSPTLRIEAGLLRSSDWTAVGITIPDDPGRTRQAPPPLLRRTFEVPGPSRRARLYATAHGVFSMAINGRPVSEDVLAPGWTAYRDRLLVEAYDVTDLLRVGDNVITGVVGDGWYRGRLGWGPDGGRGRYGTDVALLAQLEVELDDGSALRVTTDSEWRASNGAIRAADFYDGSEIDLREEQDGWEMPGFEDGTWAKVVEVPFDRGILEPRIAPPVRVAALIPVSPVEVRPGLFRIDGGQNVTGHVRLRVRGRRDQRVTVRHAEVLEADGSLHTRSLRSAKATDTFVLADDQAVVLEPMFTFHGFRYAEIETDADVLDAAYVAISSATPRRGTFESSDSDLNRLHENVVWSQRDNFVSVPTDCPQRDERLGWTGDAQAFASTASTLFDAQSFWTSWLRDLALDQDPVLGVPSVVPDVVLQGEARFGRAGWADAATIVPWAVYEAYGDIAVVRDQYSSMQAWIESLIGRCGPDGLLSEAFQFGDWLDPTAPPDRPWEARTDSTFLANAYFAYSARLTARAATLIGAPSDAARYEDVARSIGSSTWARWREHLVSNQTGCAVAIQFGLVPDDERQTVGDLLAAQVRATDGRVATGFLGTPLVLPALAATGHLEEAYLALLCREVPSWLYQVTRGATTVWERWDAIRPDGSIHPGVMSTPPGVEGSGEDGQMLSFNHYAYGAVVDWIYRTVAGLAPDVTSPGYRRVIMAPRLDDSITFCKAALEAPQGLVSIAWRVEGETFSAVVDLPFGTTGLFDPPCGPSSVVVVDGRRLEGVARHSAVLAPGRHTVEVSRPALVSTVAPSRSMA